MPIALAFGNGISKERTQGIAGLRLSVAPDQADIQLSRDQHRDETLASGRLLHGNIVRRLEPKHFAGAARTAALDVPLRLSGIQSEIVFEDPSGPEGRGLNVLGDADLIEFGERIGDAEILLERMKESGRELHGLGGEGALATRGDDAAGDREARDRSILKGADGEGDEVRRHRRRASRPSEWRSRRVR